MPSDRITLRYAAGSKTIGVTLDRNKYVADVTPERVPYPVIDQRLGAYKKWRTKGRKGFPSIKV